LPHEKDGVDTVHTGVECSGIGEVAAHDLRLRREGG
jgi:hypothetical protein